MKYLIAVVVGVVCCGCMSNDDSQGGMNRDSMEESGSASSSQRENVMRNHVSDNLKNPSSTWNTP